MNAEQKHSKNGKRFLKETRFLLLALALVLIFGTGFLLWDKVQAGEIPLGPVTPTAENSDSSGYKTTTVRRSDLSVAVSGSGSVITAQSVALGFSIEGTVGKLNVQPGDQVMEGQVLATLADTAALQQTILDQKLAITIAEKALEDLQSGGTGALAQAQLALASAQEAYATAKANVHSKGDARCSQNNIVDAYYKYLHEQSQVDYWESALHDPRTGYGYDYIMENLNEQRKERDQAYYNYTYCQGYTDQEIQVSQAGVQLAKARLDQASANYESLKTSAGVDRVALAEAEATLNNAKLQLSKAEDQLAGTTITAPMDGTVTRVDAKVGEAVDTSTIITIADLMQPQVQLYIDETDLQNFATGCAAEVTFDSLPGETFPGVVTQVSPVLVTVNSSSMVEGLVELQKKQNAAGKTLSVGMTASVEVTCHQAKNALIVPAQALYQPEGQSAYVYVLNDQGQPDKRDVVVGLKTVASVEVTSGLSEGEKIITSQIESK